MKLPGQSAADHVLQADAAQMVLMLESASAKTCKQSKIVNTELVDYSATHSPGKDSWTERWTVDRCGEIVYYSIGFIPSPSGGTDFTVAEMR